jgi:dihydroorotase
MSKIVSIPGIIDPHVHFRTPGAEYKEDYTTGPTASKFGGVVYTLDMPNTNPATTDRRQLRWKQEQAKNAPIRIGFQFGLTDTNLEEIKTVENEIAAIKVFFGSSTGNLLVNNLEYLEKVMRETTKLMTFHAEDEEIVQANAERLKTRTDPAVHSEIRSPEAAASAVKKILGLTEKTNHPTYFCHVSTKLELDLIRAAKTKGLPVYAEATPHHLFLDISAFDKWGNGVKMNPPLREKADVEALWEAVVDGTIDTIGSDHAPHLWSEKELGYSKAPAGVPGTETMLPLMLNAVNEGRLTIERLVELMSTNPATIFGLDITGLETVVDLDEVREVKKENLHSKCGWSPYVGMKLTGWPIQQKEDE